MNSLLEKGKYLVIQSSYFCVELKKEMKFAILLQLVFVFFWFFLNDRKVKNLDVALKLVHFFTVSYLNANVSAGFICL